MPCSSASAREKGSFASGAIRPLRIRRLSPRGFAKGSIYIAKFNFLCKLSFALPVSQPKEKKPVNAPHHQSLE